MFAAMTEEDGKKQTNARAAFNIKVVEAREALLATGAVAQLTLA